jgi:hypothetical protein
MKLELAAAAGVAGGLLAAGPMALMGLGALAVAELGISLGSFLALTAPFTARAVWKDWPVGLMSPGILLLRDLALAYGLASGMLQAPRPASEAKATWLENVQRADPTPAR